MLWFFLPQMGIYMELSEGHHFITHWRINTLSNFMEEAKNRILATTECRGFMMGNSVSGKWIMFKLKTKYKEVMIEAARVH